MLLSFSFEPDSSHTRFAKGEINKEEYEEMRMMLE
jgi:uncharacterized membrane protein